MEKTHYRKVFKSDHLGSEDLEEMIEEKRPLIFTISRVQQEIGTKVAGKQINANIAYFKENIKPLVLNATNSKTMKKLSGGSPFVEDWKNIVIELYIDQSVKMKGEVVGGVRIKEEPPKTLTDAEVNEVMELVKKETTLEGLTKLYNSNITYKTNPTVVDAFRNRNKELKK